MTTGRELFHTPPSANSFVKFVQLKDRQLLTRCSSQKISLMSMRQLIQTMRRKALEGGDVIPVVAIWPIACFAVAVN